MKKQKTSAQESKQSDKGWKVIKNLNPVRKPMAAKRKKSTES